MICGNGTGIPVFRQLQKVHTPFIAGVLYTNDVDYRLARLLADQVITEKPFYGNQWGNLPESFKSHGKL